MMSELVKDVAGYEPLHSPPGQVPVLRKLLQEAQCTHHILRELQRLLPKSKKGVVPINLNIILRVKMSISYSLGGETWALSPICAHNTRSRTACKKY